MSKQEALNKTKQSSEDDDPFDDPVWQQAELMTDAPPRPVKGYVTCTLGWLARAQPLASNVNQLIVLLLLYRKCLMSQSRSVSLPNQDLQPFGISRFAKYRILAALQEAGAVLIKARNGKAVTITLVDFP
jgi:hypothetical protein